MKKSLLGSFLAIVVVSSAPAQSQVRITEVSAWGSGNAPYATDWFELTNFGASAVNITGWRMDDNSDAFGSAVALTGITSIAAGESVIFTESAATDSFLNTWFGSSAPAGLQIGNYSGSGVGLSTSGDHVNIFNGVGVVQANVAFNGSPGGPFPTFDNSAGLNNTTISVLSVTGVNSAFVAVNDSSEIGSPGIIAAPVPEPETYALMLAGLGLIGAVARKRSR